MIIAPPEPQKGSAVFRSGGKGWWANTYLMVPDTPDITEHIVLLSLTIYRIDTSSLPACCLEGLWEWAGSGDAMWWQLFFLVNLQRFQRPRELPHSYLEPGEEFSCISRAAGAPEQHGIGSQESSKLTLGLPGSHCNFSVPVTTVTRLRAQTR